MLTTEERTARLAETLKRLRLPTVRACYEEQADLARREALSYEHYLLELVERECEVRQQKRIERYLRESKLPLEKTLEAAKGGLKWHEIMGLMTHIAVKGVGAVQGSDEIGAELKAAVGGKMSKLLKLGAWVLADAAADLEDEGR